MMHRCLEHWTTRRRNSGWWIFGALLLFAVSGCASSGTAGSRGASAAGESPKDAGLRIGLTSILVEDQEHALQFYTEVLGFEKATDIPLGEFRFLTVTSPAGAEGVELLLEPNAHPAAKAFQKAIFEDGIPVAVFFVEDLEQSYRRLKSLGVAFTAPPASSGAGSTAIFEDTCGNLLRIYQQ